MIRLCAALAASLALLCAAPASAQVVQAYIDSVTRKVVSVETGRPFPTIGKQETFQLVSGNSPSAPVTVAGGDYILAQTCSGYGTLSIQVLGPDGSTWLLLGAYTSSDAGSGHGFALGSYAKVRISVSGTAGCNALLSRVPA